MKATFTGPGRSPGDPFRKTSSKQMTGTINLIVNSKFGPSELAAIRIYHSKKPGTSGTTLAFWLLNQKNSRHGIGTCNSPGLHQSSAALADALDSAGITLSERIAGRGESAIDSALRAIAKLCGYSGKILIIKNGS